MRQPWVGHVQIRLIWADLGWDRLSWVRVKVCLAGYAGLGHFGFGRVELV